MTIRQFRQNDSQRCCDIINNCISELSGLNSQAIEYIISKNRTDSLIREMNGYQSLVFVSNSSVQGIGALDKCEIKRVYIEKGKQRQGIGKSLVKELVKLAIDQGCESIMIEASIDSQLFWEKQGFVGLSQKTNKLGNMIFQHIDMIKTLI